MIVLAIEDVTNLRASEAALREIVGELEAFSYSIAHDLRAPLRSMQGFADLLLSQTAPKLDGMETGYLQRIAKSCVRMDRLIQDVLNYSKVVRGQATIERVNLDSLMREIVEAYPDPRANGNIEIVGTLPPVLANQAVLNQCISNLLGNALKFVSPGTTPRIKVSAEERASDATDPDAGRESGVVRIWFEDNGIGIAPENHARIFQMLERIHPGTTYEGTGIGLAIVRKGIERMGGRYGLESQLGKGSRFWIELKKAN
jgi:signal transduction histidine kinase